MYIYIYRDAHMFHQLYFKNYVPASKFTAIIKYIANTYNFYDHRWIFPPNPTSSGGTPQ